jgi:uncharacterized membrane protein
MDALERERLRRTLATRMGMFLESTPKASCVSSHVYEEATLCELCGRVHAEEMVVVKNRSGRKMKVSLDCLLEMVRFRVVDVEDLPKWLEKLKVLKVENEKRKLEAQKLREEERKRLEKKVILRKKTSVS